MQWYLASLFMLLLLVGSGFLTGSLVLHWLPRRMQPVVRVFLIVPLGWAVLTLVITLLGWYGPGYANCHSVLVMVALASAGWWKGRAWLGTTAKDGLRLGAFCIIASFPVLAPLARGGAYNLYNDTFLYNCQAQWLQTHSFSQTASTAGGHPAWSAVILMQETHLRMGAAFLLGWIQALFALDLSIDAFPATAALGLICGALGVGATVAAAAPGRWVEAWLTALAVAVTVNGFGFGAANGFLPQTWGLALFLAAFGLRGLEASTKADKSEGSAWRTGIAIGLCFAAAVHCYWDLLPLAAPALAGTYLLSPLGWGTFAWRNRWQQIKAPLLTIVMLVNLEWGRAVRGIWLNIHAVVANPVAWPIWAFPAHALGLKTSVWERSLWITQGASKGALLGGCLAVALWLAVQALTEPVKRWKRWLQSPHRSGRWCWLPLVPAIVWISLSSGLFLYFRYVMASPWQGQKQGIWPDGTGQSWSQYKVTIWSSCAVVGVVTACGIRLARKAQSAILQKLFLILLGLWCGTGLGWNFTLARWRSKELREHAGSARDPLAACRALRELAVGLPAGDRIYLEWPADGTAAKYRELMAYFLCDRPIFSVWETGYLAGSSLTQERAAQTKAGCQWILQYQPPSSNRHSLILGPGAMTLSRAVP